MLEQSLHCRNFLREDMKRREVKIGLVPSNFHISLFKHIFKNFEFSMAFREKMNPRPGHLVFDASNLSSKIEEKVVTDIYLKSDPDSM